MPPRLQFSLGGGRGRDSTGSQWRRIMDGWLRVELAWLGTGNFACASFGGGCGHLISMACMMFGVTLASSEKER